jgi:hypothetical protein
MFGAALNHVSRLPSAGARRLEKTKAGAHLGLVGRRFSPTAGTVPADRAADSVSEYDIRYAAELVLPLAMRPRAVVIKVGDQWLVSEQGFFSAGLPCTPPSRTFR